MSEIRADKLHNASGDNDSGIDLSTNDVVAIDIAGSEKARVDSDGNLFVAHTSKFSPISDGGVGISLNANGQIFAGGVNPSLYVNREDNDGDIAVFRKDGTSVGSIGVTNAVGVRNTFICGTLTGISFANAAIFPVDNNGNIADNSKDLGFSSGRYDDIFATNSTINTSDRNEKQDIEELTEAEQRVAVACKGLMRKYRWRDAVAKKGDNARTHFGIIAQDLQDAFTAEGLDASDYAMFTSNTWWEKEISVDAVEADEENGIEAKDAYTYIDTKQEETEGYTEKTRLGIRYSELLAFIISAI